MKKNIVTFRTPTSKRFFPLYAVACNRRQNGWGFKDATKTRPARGTVHEEIVEYSSFGEYGRS